MGTTNIIMGAYLLGKWNMGALIGSRGGAKTLPHGSQLDWEPTQLLFDMLKKTKHQTYCPNHAINISSSLTWT